jgi:signal transduction histidine kinase/ligand-binding sensor domain-containing protein
MYYLLAVKIWLHIRILPIICLAFGQLATHAQQGGSIPFVKLSTKNGLSSNLVHCLLQDAQGFIWIGTANGLNRYDGIGFKQYLQRPDLAASLPHNYINNLCQDAKGQIWIGTRNGLAMLDRQTERFTHYLPGTNCFVSMDKKGVLWASNDSRISSFVPLKNTFVHNPVDLGQQLGITRNFNMRAAFEDHKGRFWLPTSYGVKLFDREKRKLQSFHYPEQEKSLPQNAITSVCEDREGHVYASTWGGGLLRLNEATNQFDNLLLDGIFGTNIIQNMLFDGETVWLATEAGLIQTQTKALQPGKPVQNYLRHTHNSGDDKSLAAGGLWCLLKDRAGSIWVGGQGISRHDPLLRQFATLRNLRDNNKVLEPTAFVHDPFNNTHAYYFGTYDFYGIVKPTDSMRRITQEPYLRNKNFGSVVWDIALGKKGFWLATTNGLLQLGPNRQLLKHYPGQVNGTNTLSGERLWKVYEDSKGLVWVATVRHGIGLVNPVTHTIQNFFSKQGEPNSLFNVYPTAFMEDRQGNIWFGGNERLYVWQRNNGRFSVITIGKAGYLCRPFMQDGSGQIWLATNHGFLRYDPGNQQITPIVTDNPELNNSECVTVDKQGHIWLGTSTGLFCYDTTAKKLKKYTTQNGLESNDNISRIYTMPNGDILLGGAGYITRFNPLQLRNNSYLPPLAITRVQVNGHDTNIVSGLRLPYHASIGFEFAALNFCNAEKNQYQYMLQGIDKDWIPANGQRSVLYGELPPGNYVFKVKGSNDDGLWNESPAHFTFTISTPWHRSAWFIVPALLLLVLLLYAAYRYRLRQLLAMERLRTRIATDLHDDIGATLSSISMYSEAVKNQLKGQNPQLENVLHKMGESSREMVTSMSDIVWAISPGNDEGDKLIKRMEDYAADLCALRGIKLHFSADEKMADIQLPLEHRKNIYLIFKESVNNAVKYAGAQNIWVSLALQGKTITLMVKDDGKGYDPATVRPGNGLKNLRLRATEIGGTLSIAVETGKGVEVRLVVG